MEASYTADAVRQHVLQLASATDNRTIEVADRWLQRFRKSPQAWHILGQLLASPGCQPKEVQVLSAQILRRKLQLDEAVEQLGQEGTTALWGQMMNYLSSFRHGPVSVRTQLCLATAALATQQERTGVGIPPDTAIREVVSQLQAAGNEGRGVLVEFLKVVAEEAQRPEEEADEPAVKTAGKDAWVKGQGSVDAGNVSYGPERMVVCVMKSLGASVLQCLAAAQQSGAETADVLVALTRWTKLAEPNDISQSGLVSVALQELCNVGVAAAPWEDAGECIAEIATVSQRQPQLAQMLISAVPHLESAFGQAQAPRQQRGVAIALSGIALAHAEQLAAATSTDAVRMVALLAHCASHPETESIGVLSYAPMHAIATHASRLPADQKDRALGTLSGHVLSYSAGLLQGVKRMNDDDEFRRMHLVPACRDAVMLNPVGVTEQIVGELQRAVSLADEEGAEAALWFIQAAPGGLRAHPPAAQAVLQVRWPTGTDLPPSCRAAFAGVCGRLSWLLRDAAELVIPVLSYVEAALADESRGYSPIREAGGSALADLSFGCAEQLAEPAGAHILLRAYGHAPPILGQAEPDDASAGSWSDGLVRAVAAVLSNARAEHRPGMVAQLTEQMTARGQAACQRGDGNALRGELRLAAALLESLPRMNGDADVSLCLPILQSLWQPAEVAIRRSSDTAHDGCRFVTAAAQAAPTALKDGLGQVTQTVAEGFRDMPYPDHLKTAAAILNAYSRHGDYQGPLVEFVAAFAQHTLQVLASSGLDQGAAFAAELFGLLRVTTNSMPVLFLRHSVTPQCIQAAVTALTSEALRETLHNHRAAIVQAVSFLESLVADGDGAAEAMRILNSAGPPLVAAVVGALARRDLPTFKNVSEVLRRCAVLHPGSMEQWLVQACGQLPNRSAAAQRAMQDFVAGLSMAGTDQGSAPHWQKCCDHFNRNIEVV
eukprot:Hpha_TRINITY_DN16383_c0_g5::TRINITY_DN16383_c0_g5_i1::g.58472::m.58472/K15436/TRPO3, MTR10; transportin-3